MKKLVLMSLFCLFSCPAWAEVYTVDTENSAVFWTGTKVTGEHFGTIELQSGTILFEDGQFAGGEAVIDMSSLAVEDLEDPKSNQQLTGHLKSDDFFGVNEHPVATLKITGVEPEDEENWYQVTGDFTIKGVTESVTFEAWVAEEDGLAEAEAEIVIDRTPFGVRYGSGKFFENLGDKLIHDEFTLEISIEAEVNS